MQRSTLQSKRERFRTFFSGLFRPSPHVKAHRGGRNISGPISESHTSSSPPLAQPYGNSATNTVFPGAHDFVINNFQLNSSTVSQGMKTLSKRAIEGAEYDSSLRDPPPQCHPGTRVELMKKILTWFRDDGREKALFWLSGPAGVGKSAVIQTVAESLVKSNSIGATLFFSRLNDRNDPQRVFITLAYQLATRIPAYQDYVIELITRDPTSLRKGMREQFRVFITEPFGNNGIGKGGGPWAVLLDGLDECAGVDEQSRIIRLVSEFVLEFPNAPLIWAIASRPEPHIVASFDDETVTRSYWSDYVPIDSTQACRDVEHYLDSRFKAMRKPFPYLPLNWPSEFQFLKLSSGARGLFIFARTAVRFIEDPDYADPISRLNLILSIIDRLDINVIDDHPFALLDALYTQILTSIPSSVWCTTKRILGFVICVHTAGQEFQGRPGFSSRYGGGLSYPLDSGSRSLIGTSAILGLEPSVTYGSLHKLHSVLGIPDSKEAHLSPVKFLHASFGDYLTDMARSKDFYINRGKPIDDIIHGLFQLHLDKLWVIKWERYTPQLSRSAGSSFYKDLMKDAESSLECILTGGPQAARGRGPLRSQRDRSEYLDALSQINLVEVYKNHFYGAVATLLIELWNTFREELESSGRFKEIPLRNLKVDHLDDIINKPVFTHKGARLIITSCFEPMKSQLSGPLVSRFAMIFGSSPERRIACFAGSCFGSEGYFCFPYPY